MNALSKAAPRKKRTCIAATAANTTGDGVCYGCNKAYGNLTDPCTCNEELHASYEIQQRIETDIWDELSEFTEEHWDFLVKAS